MTNPADLDRDTEVLLRELADKMPEPTIRTDLADRVIRLSDSAPPSTSISKSRRIRRPIAWAGGVLAVATITAMPSIATASYDGIRDALAALTDDHSSAQATHEFEADGPEGSQIDIWNFPNPKGGNCTALAFTTAAGRSEVTDRGCGRMDYHSEAGPGWLMFRWQAPSANWYTILVQGGGLRTTAEFRNATGDYGVTQVGDHQVLYWGKQVSPSAMAVMTDRDGLAKTIPMQQLWRELVPRSAGGQDAGGDFH